jgi:exodeoxyribonuclease VII large subunit
VISSPRIIIYNRLHDIQNIVSNIKTFNTLYLKNQAGYLGHYASLIKMMAPDNILKKGFAILKTNNRITSNPDDLKVGEDVEIILMDTQIRSTVTQKTKYNGKDFNI